MTDLEKIPRRTSKKDRITHLLEALDRWQKEGNTPEEAIGRLTMAQYDFLVEENVNLDNFLLTEAQQKMVKAIIKQGRPNFPNGYDKKYPKEKQELYGNISQLLQNLGADITKREKENFRDLDFTLDGVAYKIVLSQPRKKA